MKVSFFHDAPLVMSTSGDIYSYGFTYELWERYLKVFDEITVSTRLSIPNDVEVNYKNMKLSSGPRVIFKPISSYKKFKDILYSYHKIVDEITESLMYTNCAIIRLPSIIGYLALREAIKMKKPYLIEVVGCPKDALWNHSLAGKFIAVPSFYLMKNALLKADYIMYVTNNYLQEKYPSLGKAIGISDVSLVSVDKCNLENRINKIKNTTDKTRLVIGTIGAVDVSYKGQEYVIESISELKKKGFNFMYYLVGSGNTDYLKKVAKKFKVENNIFFLGPLPHDKIFEFLDSIDIYIQPSKTEGMPRALIEAMSRGCPALGANVGGIPELLENKYIFKKASVSEISNILIQLNDEMMIEAACNNFSKSLEFDNKLLKEQRINFYQKFSESVSKND